MDLLGSAFEGDAKNFIEVTAAILKKKLEDRENEKIKREYGRLVARNEELETKMVNMKVAFDDIEALLENQNNTLIGEKLALTRQIAAMKEEGRLVSRREGEGKRQRAESPRQQLSPFYRLVN